MQLSKVQIPPKISVINKNLKKLLVKIQDKEIKFAPPMAKKSD